MVGRERELGAGTYLLTALERGCGCLVLEGEAGIGKTTVWEAVLAEGERRGCRLLSCAPAAAEAKLSYAGLADLLRTVDRSILAGLPGPQRRALEVALLEAAPGPRPRQPRAVFAGFCSVLFAVATERAVLVGVDDMQWLDQSTQAALAFALRRLGAHRIGFVCSLRVGDSPGLTAGLARALVEADAQRVAVGPLSVGALHEVLVAKLGRNLPRPVVVRIKAATRGNPFYALEVARELASAGPTATLPVPDEVSALVAARVRRLPRPTRDALLVAAALSNPRLGLLDRAALGPAEEAGLIEVGSTRVAFAHPLFAAAVYGSASMPERQELHRRLAPLMDDPEERARHLALGSEGASEEIALELAAAADRSVARGAPDAAAGLLELAVRMTPEGSGHQRELRELAAAECHFHGGDQTRARSLCEHVLAGSPTRLVRGRALQLIGEIRYHDSSFREAIPLLEEALALLGDDPRAVELHVNLSFAYYSLGDIAGAAAHGHSASAAAAAAGVVAEPFQAAALAASTMADFYFDRPVDRARIEAALALEDPEQHMVMVMRPSLVAGLLAFFSDELERAGTLFEALRQRTLDLGEESSLPHVDVYLSMLERTRGDVQRALALSERALEIARMLGSATAQALALAELCYVCATLGDVDAARDAAKRMRATARAADIGYAFGWARSAVAFLDLSIGDPRATSEALESLLVDIERSGRCNPMSVTFGLPDGIEALVALGELDRAEALTALLERHGRNHDRASALARAARCRALLAAARGEPASARAEIEQALVNHARVQMPLELGRTLLAKGQIERRAKQKRAARDSFEATLERFDSIGARLWAQRARAELERTGSQHSEGDALTPTELRIAELAATGLTNKRIADTAFVSAKTVEANLARIYLKLGIRSRAELGRAMAETHSAASATRDGVPPAGNSVTGNSVAGNSVTE